MTLVFYEVKRRLFHETQQRENSFKENEWCTSFIVDNSMISCGLYEGKLGPKANQHHRNN